MGTGLGSDGPLIVALGASSNDDPLWLDDGPGGGFCDDDAVGLRSTLRADDNSVEIRGTGNEVDLIGGYVGGSVAGGLVSGKVGYGQAGIWQFCSLGGRSSRLHSSSGSGVSLV